MSDDEDALLDDFLADVSEAAQREKELIEERRKKQRTVYGSGAEEVERLVHRKGAMYFNLNPFEVLRLDPEADASEIKGAYRRLSVLVHPDKNGGSEDAQNAFDLANKAYRQLTEEDELEFCREVVESAKRKLDEDLHLEKKQARNRGEVFEIPDAHDEEYRKRLHKTTCSMFADIHLYREFKKKKNHQDREREARKEMHENELELMERQHKRMMEETQESRVNSWRDFQHKAGRKRKQGA